MIERKLSNWILKHMSLGGRLVLINFVLTSLTMFMLYFLSSRRVFEKIEYYRSSFLSSSQKKKYRITDWSIIYQCKGNVV
jgi:hypothetical protein